MEIRKGFWIYAIAYIVSAIAIYLVFTLKERLNNPLILALLIALAIPLLIYFINLPLKRMLGSGLSRYTMRCNSCHWEWMSNIGEKAPDTCPKCHKNNLGIVGWRKIEADEIKNNKTLEEFFK